MEFQDVVLNRKSVRRFAKRPVTEEQVRTLLELAHAAPSAGNLRPWEFIIIRDHRQIEQVVQTTFAANQENGTLHQDWILTAPVVIAVCADLQKIEARYGQCSLCESLRYLDCSAAAEHILLGAVDLGLSACYVCGFRIKELSRALRLPEHIYPVALLPLGYAEGEAQRRIHGSVEKQIHRECYGAYAGSDRGEAE